MTEKSKRSIRSFVLRQGRMTEGQQKAYQTLWSKYGIEFLGEGLDVAAIFGSNRPVVLEIGFGMGDSLWQMAKMNPELNYLGIEVHGPGVGCLMASLEREGVSNVRIIQHDAVEVLEKAIADNTLARVQLYFPDPWPKKKHHKRRIVQPVLIKLLSKKLIQEGTFHAATDWQAYAEHMMTVLSAEDSLINRAGEGHYSARPAYRPETKFERRGLDRGHGVWDLIFSKA